MDFLQSGDIILFKGHTFVSYILEYFGRSPYSHVGMIVRNPSYLNKDLEDGIYLLESGWNAIPDAETGAVKVGVQIHFLADILAECAANSVFVRKVECKRDAAFYETLQTVHRDIQNKPYDLNPWDWLMGLYSLHRPLPLEPAYQQIDRFWCSALLAYIFEKLGLIEPVNWSLVGPREFGDVSTTQLQFLCYIGKEDLLR
jgi:hypothetical protein